MYIERHPDSTRSVMETTVNLGIYHHTIELVLFQQRLIRLHQRTSRKLACISDTTDNRLERKRKVSNTTRLLRRTVSLTK